MLVRDALVAEVLADLVDPVEPADDEALQVELVGDTQVEVRLQLVRMRDEGVCESPAVTGLQDGCLDLEEPVLVEVTPNSGDHPRADEEIPPGRPRRVRGMCREAAA